MEYKSISRDKSDFSKNLENLKINNIISSQTIQWLIFYIPFEKFWLLVKNPSQYSLITSNIYPNIFISPIKISKNKFNDIHNEFSIQISNKITATLSTEDIIETDYFCQIQWTLESSLEETPFLLTATINKISDEQTLYSLKLSNKTNKNNLIYNSINNNEPLQEEKYNSILLSSNKYFNVYTYYVKLDNFIKTIFQTQTETNLISANFNLTKEYFLNARVCTQMMGEIISTTGERIKNGTIVVYISKKNQKKCTIQVRHCLIKKISCILIFYIYEANYSSYPTRELRVELFSVNHNETFVSLTHNFIKPIPTEDINYLSLAKRRLLKKLGSVIEKTYKLNYSNNKKMLRILEKQVIPNYDNDNSIEFGSVDCNKNIWLSLRFNITHIPYSVLIDLSKQTMYEFKSYSTAELINEFIESDKKKEDGLIIPKPYSYIQAVKTVVIELYFVLKEKIEDTFSLIGFNVKVSHFILIPCLVLLFGLVIKVQKMIFAGIKNFLDNNIKNKLQNKYGNKRKRH